MEYILCEECNNKGKCKPDIIHYIQAEDSLGVRYEADVWKCTRYNPKVKLIDRERLRELAYNNHDLKGLVERLMREDKISKDDVNQES